MNQLLSNYIACLRKLYGSQNSLVKMLENCKNALDEGGSVCVLFIDFSKAFDAINHDLLLVKPKAYCFLKSMENLSKCQEVMIKQQEFYEIFYIIKIIINSSVLYTSIPRKINFVRKLEKGDGAFFNAEKKQKTILNLSLDSLIVTE